MIAAWQAGMFGRYFSIHSGGISGTPARPQASMSAGRPGPAEQAAPSRARSSMSDSPSTAANETPNRSGGTAPFARPASRTACCAATTPSWTNRAIALSDFR